MAVNHFHCIGNLTKDVILKYTQSGKAVTSLTLAINELDGEINIIRGWRKVLTRFDNTTTRIREYWVDERAA
jgi:single-stranded DNA-binding protein